MRISDWSSDVCSSDLVTLATGAKAGPFEDRNRFVGIVIGETLARVGLNEVFGLGRQDGTIVEYDEAGGTIMDQMLVDFRSDEHTFERQSPMRNSYAVFCLTQKIPVITQLGHLSIVTSFIY